MDLYQIRYFLAIADIGSFTKAAEQLHISQPSLSAGIKKLERELDVQLFERGRRVILTPAGRLFKEKAQAILAEYRSAHQDLRQFKESPTLHLATLHSLRASNLARIIKRFRAQHPSVVLEICNGDLNDMQTRLEQGNVDVAITWLGEQDTPKNSQFLFHQPLALAVPSDHPFAALKSVALADLDGQLYVERINCEFWRSQPKMFEMAGIKPKVVYSANNEEWAISLIQAGAGVSIMPIWCDIQNIVYVPLSDLSLSRSIGLRWRPRQQLDPVQWFRKFAMEIDWHISP